MSKGARISAENFLAITDVFKSNGWEIPEETSGYESRFNRFCERLSLLDNDEQKFIIDLTRRFTAIDSTEYLSVIMKLLNENTELRKTILSQNRKFYIFPLISPDDFEKTKSSKFVWYLLRDEKIKYHKVFTEKELVFCDICQVSWIENIKPSEKVFLVDDFIGSGETAEKAINWYINHHNIKLDKIAILALAAQRAGIEALQQKGIEVYTYYCFDKGISDFYTGDELDKYTTLMEKIESKLKVDARYNFGYNRSEALVALTRAPNNTFPVFWRKNGKNKIVPFPRD